MESPFEIPIYSLKGAQTGTPLEDSMADGTTASVHFDLPLVSCHQPVHACTMFLLQCCPSLSSHPIVPPYCPTLLSHSVIPPCCPTHSPAPMLLLPCCPTLLSHPLVPPCFPTLVPHPVIPPYCPTLLLLPPCCCTLLPHPVVPPCCLTLPCPTLLFFVFYPVLFLRTLSLFQ